MSKVKVTGGGGILWRPPVQLVLIDNMLRCRPIAVIVMFLHTMPRLVTNLTVYYRYLLFIGTDYIKH